MLKTFGLGLVMVVAACGGSSKPAEQTTPVANTAPAANAESAPAPAASSSAEDAMRKMQELRDAMCACKDAACGQKVADELTTWAQKMSAEQTQTPMSEAQTQRATQLGTEMGECMQRAMGAGSGAATP